MPNRAAMKPKLKINVINKNSHIKAEFLDTVKSTYGKYRRIQTVDMYLRDMMSQQEQTSRPPTSSSASLRTALLHGQLNPIELPEPQSKVIRVYLSCTSTDSVEERIKLMTDGIPELREYAREKHCLEFQVVDPRWGTSHDWSDWDPTRDLSTREVLECKRLTKSGPNFVVLAGQRYGAVPLPLSMPSDYFNSVRNALSKFRTRHTRDVGLLDVWYNLDTNVMPAVYRLLPMDDGKWPEKKFYEENKLLFQDRAYAPFDWAHTREALQRLFQRGIEMCIKEATIDVDVGFWYISSDLEREVELGLVRALDPRRNCQAYLRDIVDLKNYLTSHRAHLFTEIACNDKKENLEIDPERSARVRRLRDERICGALQHHLVTHSDFLWRHDRGVDPVYHAAYLSKLNAKFVENMKMQIDEYVMTLEPEEKNTLLYEIIQHWQVAREKSCDFIGRDGILERIQSYISSSDKSPLVIHGESGSGKSAVMAKAASSVKDWLGARALTVVRFIGSTAGSFDTRQLMFNICQQVSQALGQVVDVPNTYKELQQHFQDMLGSIPQDKTLVIFMDSLDSLVPQYNAHYLHWLPQTLSQNVKLVLSTLPTVHGLLDRLRHDMSNTSPDNLLELPPMEVDECLDLLRMRLALESRRLQPLQEESIRQAFKQCSLPLYALLVLRQARQWRSSDQPPSLIPTIPEFLQAMFEELEARHGRMLVDHALCFLTASSSGVSDCEMEDLLSLDDVVLGEIISSRGGHDLVVHRLPGVYWMKLKKDIRDYLVEKDAEGVTVSNWFHRQFVEAVRERYLSKEEKRQFVHSSLADYHLGLWYNKLKPYNYPLSKRGECQSADRYVVSQPLTFKGRGSANSTMYNKRKYEQVPRHLYLSGRLAELNTFVLFSYSFLYNKTKALSLEHVLADFVLNPGVEATLVEKALRDAQPFMEVNIDNMGPELVGRLLPYYSTHSNVRKLIRECDSAGSVHCGLVPNFPYHQVPGSPLRYMIDCVDNIDDVELVCDDCRFALCKNNNKSAIHMLDLATGEHCGKIETSIGFMRVSPNSQYIIVCDPKFMTVKIHLAEDGSLLGHLIPLSYLHSSTKYQFGKVAMSDTFLVFIITGETSNMFIADLEFCKIVEMIPLTARATLCEITPDYRYVFTNSAETMIGYDIATLEEVCNIPLTARPMKMVFTPDSTRAFFINAQELIVHVLALRDGVADFEFKLPLEDFFPADTLQDIVLSQNQNLLLVRGGKSLAVYQMNAEKVVAVFTRPVDVPTEFKLPRSNYRQIHFTQAGFSPDSKFVIASIFRNIYIWKVVNGTLLTTLQAPVGIVTMLRIPVDRGQIVSVLENTSHVHVWSLGDAIGHISQVDRLTRPVSKVLVDAEDKVAFVGCKDSDEIGLVNMTTGLLADLLTHEGPVHDYQVSCSGNHVFVALKRAKPGLYNKIWDVQGRRIIYEFGNVPGHLIALQTQDALICVIQGVDRYHEPYRLYQYKLKQGTYEELQFEQQLPFVLEKPFVTPDDRYLVIMTADSFDEHTVSHTNPTVAVISLKSNMEPCYYSAEDMRKLVRMRRILHVRPCPSNAYTVIIIYTNESEDLKVVDGIKKLQYDYAFGFLLFDIAAGVVCQVIDNFVHPQTPLNSLLFNANTTLCVDQESNVYDMGTGYFKKQIYANDQVSPKLLALNASVAVFVNGQNLFAVRISDSKMVGHVNVHGTITCVSICHDDRTLLVGCEDGAIISYVVIDADSDDITEVTKHVKSRALPLNKTASDETVEELSILQSLSCRSWDKVDFENHMNAPPYSRPPSGILRGPTDAEMLKRVKHLSRPHTTNGRYLTDTAMSLSRPGTAYANSKACLIM